MPWYPPAVKKDIPPGSNDPRITPRIGVLHVAATEADSLYDYFNGPSGGIEAHFYVREDGSLEQYRDTDWQADAQWDANDFAVSIETQGLGDGTWTAAQLAAIQALILWLHEKHPGIKLQPCSAWDGTGIGYHTMWGAPSHWTPVAKTCPGPHRVRQYDNIIVPWLKAGAPAPEVDVQLSDKINDTDTVGDALRDILDLKTALATFRQNELQRDQDEKAQLDALLAAVKAIPAPVGGLTVADVEAALRSVFASAGNA